MVAELSSRRIDVTVMHVSELVRRAPEDLIVAPRELHQAIEHDDDAGGQGEGIGAQRRLALNSCR